MSTENTFNIYHYSDGMRRKYGNETNLEIEDAVENLIYYDIVSSEYSGEELQDKLENMQSDFWIGIRWHEIKITKNNKDTILSEMKVGSEFYMDGLSYPNNERVKTLCVLVEYRGMNKYVVDTEDCLVLCDGGDKVYIK